jgi:periplasmic divalent cation tolerance protein
MADIGALVVLITAPPELAATLARSIVEARLAACVAITPVRSIYRWQGATHDAQEVQLVVKTATARFEALRAFVRANHTYAVPEILALPVVDADREYLAWVKASSA